MKKTKISASTSLGTALVWDTIDETFCWNLAGHKGSISKICFNPTREEIMTCSDDQTIRIWDLNNADISSYILEHEDAVFSCVYSKCGEKIVSVCNDDTCKIWNRNFNQYEEYKYEDWFKNSIYIYMINKFLTFLKYINIEYLEGCMTTSRKDAGNPDSS